MKMLAIDSSILGSYSATRELTKKFIELWQEKHPETELIYRDLNSEPINHLSGAILSAAQQNLNDLTPELAKEVRLSNLLITEFLEADILVLGAPMYNFNIPSQLKAWIDRVVVAGRTFKYTEQGPQGLAGKKTVYIFSARGGVYFNNEAMKSFEHQESYLTSVFHLVGITDLQFIRAEGVNLGPDARKQSLLMAHQGVNELFKQQQAEAL